MVAVVNGSGLGLFTSRGTNGSASLGQTREQVFVNSSTGNLVIQNVDEMLTATGADLAIMRTYNSLGLTSSDGDNNDGWRIGVVRSLAITAGTNIVKTFGDGARVTYLYNSSTGEYVSTEGDGAHDRIRASGSQWIWTDETGRNTETYDTNGRIVNSRDADGNTFSFTFGSGALANVVVQITSVSPASEGGDGSTTNIFFDYFSGTLNLERMRVVRNSVPESRTSYTYDGQNRLQTVTLDLTPGDNSVSDNDKFVTTYGYQGTTNLIASITQRGGGSTNVNATVSFTYELVNGEQRLKTYMDGEGRTTTFTYSQVSSTGGQSVTATANSGVLSTTETQNVTNNYALNSAAVSTTDTQTTTSTYNVNSSQITTGATQTDTYNRNNAALSTTDTQTTTTTYNVNSAALTTNATQTDTYNRNDAALSTTDTTTTTTNYNVNPAALTTNATQTNTYNRNDAALSTTDTTTNNYSLNTGLLTTPSGGGTWGAAIALEEQLVGVYGAAPKVAFDANGNGFAAWTRVDPNSFIATLLIARYTRSNNTWTTPIELGTDTATLVPGPFQISLAVDNAGNALIAWSNGMAGGGAATLARRYDASTGWGSTLTVGMGNGGVVASINGANAAVAWTAASGLRQDLYVSRWTGSAWAARTSLENTTVTVSSQSIAVDNQGNIEVVFAQGSALNHNRYTASTATWSGALTILTASATPTDIKVALDGNGNGFAIWAQGADVMASRYTRSNNTWTTVATVVDSGSATVSAPELAIDSAGNAIVGWVQADASAASMYARRWNAATSAWGSVMSLEASTQAVVATAGSIAVSVSGNYMAAAWLQFDGVVNNTMASVFNGTAWSTPTAIDQEPFSMEMAATPTIAVDSLGNATALWQTDGMALGAGAMSYRRFTAGGGGGAPYYTVPSGATWQSIANTLYGINSAAAGTALQTAMGNPALTTGAQLTGWPATLTVTTTVTVPAYYTIPSGATWQSIANAVYGINSAAAGSALQTAMGNPALTAGARLTGFPATLSVTTTLAAHYLVPAGATWQSIANTLYGVNSAAAGSALQTTLGNPSIAAGQRLFNIPSTLSVTTTTTVTVPAYYTIPSGATWQSIANAVYGVNNAAAGAALQAALGNPTLTTGARLTGFPATLSVTTTLAPHYLVPAGATWQSIANALYGINHANAGTALQTALGNPSIAAGTRLYNIPATLSVTITTTITVPAYYTIPSGATWQSIANAVYGINSTAAGSALQTALGNPALTTGARLTGFPATLSVTTTLAPHFVVPAGATWQSIANALYGINHANAGTALQTALGNPSIAAGARLFNIPATLTVTITATVTVPPYYVIPASPTWQAIANTLYGVNSAAAGSALQSALGNPTLTPGNRLSNLPAQLAVTTPQTVTVAPYYNVPAGATWTSITQAVYGTSDANAVAALRAAVGNPSLSTNLHITMPSTLTYTPVASAVTLSAQPGALVTHEQQTTVHNLNSAALTTTDNQTTSYNRNDAVLSTTDTQTTNFSHPLNTGALSTTETTVVTTNYPVDNSQLATTVTTTNTYNFNSGALGPVGFAASKSAFESQGGNTTLEQVQFAANGSGMAVWVRSDSSAAAEIYVRTYSASTLAWSGPVQIATATGVAAVNQLLFDMDEQGNAIVAWDNVTSSTSSTIFVRRFLVASGWGSTATLAPGGRISGFSASINGDKAIIGWVHQVNALAAAATVTSSGVWSSGMPIGVQNTQGQVRTTNVVVAVDAQGNALALLSAFQTTNYLLQSQRYTASTGTWSGIITSMDSVTSGGTNSVHFSQLKLQLDASGNAFASWHRGQSNSPTVPQSIVARRFDISSGWGTATTLATQAAGSGQVLYRENLSVDTAGNAMVVWEQIASGGGTGQIFARYFTAGSWSAAVNVSSTSSFGNPEVAISNRNGRFAIGFMQGAGTEFWAARFESGAWQSATRAGTGLNSTLGTQVALHQNGDMTALWDEGNGSTSSLSMNHYATVQRYTVPVGGATWQSVANALYGVNSLEAGNALQSAMGSPPLVEGGQMTGWPSTLTVTVTTNIGPHYVIQSGDTWQVIANRLYHVNSAEAANALQSAMGNPALTPGTRLMNPPTTLSVTVTTTTTVPPYYTIPSGASWASIALALYGVSTSAAANALQSAMGSPALTAGARLTGFPNPLNYSTTTTITVPPYYTIPSGATWQSIASTIYGANSAAAGSALQSALGNPALTAGARLTGLPATLSVTVQVTVAPYYTVPSGATWQSIAAAVYLNNANYALAGEALRVAMGNIAIVSGTRMTGFPSSISVTQTIDVPDYYLVPANATWQSVTFAVYGTPDPAAATRLQQLMPGVSLTEGAHLTMPAALDFVPSIGGPTVFMQTDVLDALGLTTTYRTNVLGQLVSVLGPTAGGTRPETRYDYDIEGNLIAVTQNPGGLNRVTSMTYDTRGNLLSTRDNAGNTVTRTYTARNQVLTETIYLTPDPDGFGNGQPGSPQTTRYVYDGEDHLRFVISPRGNVTENRYNNSGTLLATLTYGGAAYTPTDYTEALLTTWVTGRQPAQKTQYAYDFRGNVDSVTRWEGLDSSGNGTGTPSITRFVYDARGNLRSTTDARGDATRTTYTTTYTIDSLGRERRKVEWLSASSTRTTNTQYLDANNQVATTLQNGLVTTTTYDRAGVITTIASSGNVSGALGTTTFLYDRDNRLRMTTAPGNLRTYILYDDASRKVAEIDADGTLTQFVYNLVNELVKTVRYSSLLSSTALGTLVDGTGAPANVTVDNLVASLASVAGRDPTKDQISRKVYDAAGRLVFSIDPSGAIAKNIYDGAGRVVESVAFATPVSIPASVGELNIAQVSVAPSTDDRRMRMFYDADSRLIGSLDGEGYFSERVYDNAGQLTEERRYDTPTNASLRATGTFAQLVPARTSLDVATYYFYDAQGRTVGELDAEGYLTETRYGVAGLVTQKIRYQNRATYASNSTLDTLRTAATGAQNQTINYDEYDGARRLVRERNVEGTVTKYDYDAANNVTATTRAEGTADVRTTQFRYDELGRVKQELSGRGSEQITAGMTAAQIEAVWTQWAVTHVYDNTTGLRLHSTDAVGNRTWYYYDSDRRLRFTVNSLGEVAESRYDALGQTSDTYSYRARISTASLTGGFVDSTITTRVTGIANVLTDAHDWFTYDRVGRLESRQNTEGARTSHLYTAFGEMRNKSVLLDAGITKECVYTYDRRGLLRTTTEDGTGVNHVLTYTLDAFGRRTQVTDQYGNVTRTSFDKLGQVVATFTPLNERHRTEYDAFARVVYEYDAYDRVTSYTYDVANRSTTIRTPLNIAVTNVNTRHGQTFSITDGEGILTGYEYDKDGNLTRTYDGLGTIESRAYDRADELQTITNALGSVTRFTYDAASRVLTQTEDADGTGALALVTSYQYDGMGRVTRVTEPSGRITDTDYYTDGRVRQTTVDPSGLNLRTYFTYDLGRRTVTVTEGYGSAYARVMRYQYDKLDRRIEEVADYGTGKLNLTTQYRYDANGNLTRRIEGAQLEVANQRSTWFVYDANGQLRYTIDALGGISEKTYDLDGRITAVRRYSTGLTPSALGALGDRVTALTPSGNDNLDRLDRTVYDLDGRAAYTIDALGGVTERIFDRASNVVRERMYALPVTVSGNPSISQLQTALTAVGNDIVNLGTNDRVGWTAYDGRGRATYAVDALGGVIRQKFNLANDVIEVEKFATAYTGANKDRASLDAWVNTTVSGQSYSVDNDPNNRTTKYWYDNVGRVRYVLDARGYLTENVYEDAQRRVTGKAYVSGPYDISSATPISSFGSFVSADPAQDRVTVTLRDMAGRISRVTDGFGNYEEYVYDDVNNKQTYRNKLGAIWDYDYDALGRLTDEYTPSVSYYNVTDQGATLNAGTVMTQRIRTHIDYTTFGQVWKRTEAYGVTDQQRTTEYVYDKLGRQTRTNYPPVRIYDTAADSVYRVGSAVVRSDTPQSLYSEITYDTLGDAVVNRDVAGNFSYRVYDRLGRARYEVDAEAYVSRRDYDTFGNETGLTRFANPYAGTLNGTPLPFNTFSEPTTSGADRTVTKGYDKLNQLTSEMLPNVYWYAIGGGGSSTYTPLTQYVRNVFGEISAKTVLTAIDASSNGVYATTYFFTDKLGRVIAEVDPLKYLTATEYDAIGNVTRRVEYAAALASPLDYATPVPTNPQNAAGSAIGYDRDMRYGYDRLNRLRTETNANVEYSTVTGTAPPYSVTRTYKNVVLTHDYDAVGNRLSTLNSETNGTIYSYYDALGRTRAIADVSRDTGDGTTLTPITEFKRDANGEVVQYTRYAASGTAVSVSGYSVSASGPDQTSTSLLDLMGRTIRTEDASGADRLTSYNARGQAAKEWQFVTHTADSTVNDALVTIHEYDRLGREIATLEPQTLNVGGGDSTPNVVVKTAMRYNAFGEIIEKGRYELSATPVAQEFFSYDNAGRVWRTNTGDGVAKVYLYDLAGRQTAEIRARGTNLGAAAVTTVQQALTAAAGAGANPMRVERRFDLDGNAIEQRLPSFSTTTDFLTALDTTVSIGNMNRPSVLDAGYTLRTIIGIPVTQIVLEWNPNVTGAAGGGYRRDRTRDISYSYTTSRYIYWTDPPAIVGEVAQIFEYRAAGSSGAWTQATIDKVFGTDNRRYLGVSASLFGSGSYEFRIKYTREGEANPFVIRTGTVANPPSTSSTITDTTSATIAAQTSMSPVTTQVVDRWGNVIAVTDSALNTTNYRFDQRDQLLETLLPSVAITSVNSATGAITTSTGRPKTENHYDALGRLAATKDANGVVNVVVVNAASEAIGEKHADGGNRTYVYDAFGNRVGVTDELGFRTRITFNKQNLQTTTEQEITVGAVAAADTANILINNFRYDEAGRRITDADGLGNTSKTWYDLRGNVRKRATPRGFATKLVSDVHGNTIQETNPLDEWSSWTYDYFGRLLSRRELGVTTVVQTQPNVPVAAITYVPGYEHTLSYDFAGLVTTMTSTAGQNDAYTYDAAGHLTRISETGTAVANSGLASTLRQTDLVYDIMGRHARERTTIDGLVHQDMTITYDAAGRIATTWDLGAGMAYSYDAAGFRTRIRGTAANKVNAYTEGVFDPLTQTVNAASFTSLGWYYSPTARDTGTMEYWYRYDLMGRLLTSRGANVSNAVVGGSTTGGIESIAFTYDVAGNRKSQTAYGTKFVPAGGGQYSTAQDFTLESYTYDGAKRLTFVNKDNIGIPTGAYLYDAGSRQYRSTTRTVEQESGNYWLVSRVANTAFDADNRPISTTTTRAAPLIAFTESVVNYDIGGDNASTRNISWQNAPGAGGIPYIYSNPTFTWSRGFDAAGNLRGFTVRNHNSQGDFVYEVTYSSEYTVADGYVEKSQYAYKSAGNGTLQPNTTRKTYNLSGELVSVTDDNRPAANRYFANGADGKVITSVRGAYQTSGPAAGFAEAVGVATSTAFWMRYYSANGNSLGSLGFNGFIGPNQARQSLSFNVDDGSIKAADVAAPAQVVTLNNETLRDVARRIWGDASLWYLLAEENGYTDPTEVLTTGTVLTVPNQVVSIPNNASVFKPFDMGAAIGDTAPFVHWIAPPPPKPACGGFGAFIVLVIAIIITAIFDKSGSTFKLALAKIGVTNAVAQTALAAAAASIIAQGVGIAIGAQEKFDWRQVAMSAISAGVGEAVGGVGKFVTDALHVPAKIAPFLSSVINGAVTSALTQGINVALGLQESFSWREVAISGVAAGVSSTVGGFVAGNSNLAATSLPVRLASGLAGAAVRASMGGKVDILSVAADAFGHAIGDAIVAGIDAATPAAVTAPAESGGGSGEGGNAGGGGGEPGAAQASQGAGAPAPTAARVQDSRSVKAENSANKPAEPPPQNVWQKYDAVNDQYVGVNAAGEVVTGYLPSSGWSPDNIIGGTVTVSAQSPGYTREERIWMAQRKRESHMSKEVATSIVMRARLGMFGVGNGWDDDLEAQYKKRGLTGNELYAQRFADLPGNLRDAIESMVETRKTDSFERRWYFEQSKEVQQLKAENEAARARGNAPGATGMDRLFEAKIIESNSQMILGLEVGRAILNIPSNVDYAGQLLSYAKHDAPTESDATFARLEAFQHLLTGFDAGLTVAVPGVAALETMFTRALARGTSSVGAAASAESAATAETATNASVAARAEAAATAHVAADAAPAAAAVRSAEPAALEAQSFRMPELSNADIGIEWGKGIQKQGQPWEVAVDATLPPGSRTPPGYPQIDHFVEESGLAISDKTLDTLTAAKLKDPKSVYYSLRTDVNDMAKKMDLDYSGRAIDAADIKIREIRVAVPAGTNDAQWFQIARAVIYAQSKSVRMTVTPIR